MEIQLKYDGNKPGKPDEITISIPITFKNYTIEIG